MDKQTALDLWGGTIAETARALGLKYAAVHKWRDPLSPPVVAKVVLTLINEGRVKEAIKVASAHEEANA